MAVVKRCLVVLVLGACAPAATPIPRTEVAVAPASASEAPPAACTIAGDGEYVRGYGPRPRLVVQRERTGDDPIAVVAQTDQVGVAWSELPTAGVAGARAHVVLGRGVQPAAKIGGWSSLDDRIFQLQGEAVVVPDHVWLIGGIDVLVRGVKNGAVVVARTLRTGFEAPATVEALAKCTNVVWRRDAVPNDRGPLLAPATLQARFGAVELHASPGGPIVQRLAATTGARFPLTELAREASWVHVTAYLGVLRFDGWVAADQTEPLGPPGVGRLGGSHLTRPPIVHSGRAMIATKETMLYLGTSADDAKPIGVLEVGAKLDVVGSGARAALNFAPRLLEPPEDRRFFADEADLAPM
jgi:hypothetical protein